MKKLRSALKLLIYVGLSLGSTVLAQSAGETRVACWESYQLPVAPFTRVLEKEHGLTFWRPAAWKEIDKLHFGNGSEASFQILFDKIPEGYGIANYTTATLRQLRRSISPENVTVRTIFLSGVEGREITLESEGEGQELQQTFWMIEQGPLVYIFVGKAKKAQSAEFEPYFKRILLSLRLAAVGRWDEEFENLRAAYVSASVSTEANEAGASLLAERLHTGSNTAAARAECVTLWQTAPAAATDLLTDYDPNVRAVALATLTDARATGLVFWALRDKDPFVSNLAAQTIATYKAGELKAQLATLAAHPGALVRVAALLPDDVVRNWAADFLATDDTEKQLAGLRLALAFPLPGLELPYEKLLRTSQVQVVFGVLEALRLRREKNAAMELQKLLTGDLARWAVRGLGDVGDTGLRPQFESRITEIDTRLGVLLKTGAPNISGARVAPRATRGKGRAPVITVVRPPPPPPPKPLPPAALPSPPDKVKLTPDKDLSEEVRLALLRGELVLAVEKLTLRERWQKADAASQRVIASEAAAKGELAEWSRWAFAPSPATEMQLPVEVSQFGKFSTEGANIFPAETTLYTQAPDLAQTLERFSAALGSIQMESVRDQMAFTFFLQNLRKQLTGAYKAPRLPNLSAGLGADFHAPVAIAVWPDKELPLARSGFTLRVTDRERFERFLTDYQETSGGLSELGVTAAAAPRFAELLPAIVTLAAAGLWEDRRMYSGGSPLLAAHTFQRTEQWGELPVKIVERLAVHTQNRTGREQLWLAYLGDTALLAASRGAMLDMLTTALGKKAALSTNPDYQRLQSQSGEIRYFSRLEALFGTLPKLDSAQPASTPGLLAGSESGALSIADGALASTSQIKLSDTQWLTRLQDFRINDLTLPRQIWPRTTLFYAGAQLEPAQAWDTLKDLGIVNGALAKPALAAIIGPKLQGEMGVALLEPRYLQFTLGDYGAGAPSGLVYGLRLKDAALSRLAQTPQPFGKEIMTNGRMIFNRPVYLSIGEPSVSYFVVTDQYLFLAQSYQALAMLQQAGKEKISNTPDWNRVVAAEKEPLWFFATFNPEPGLELAREALPKGDIVAELTMQFLSAWTHAFHSQRLVLRAQEGNLSGSLAVSFDRAGRLSADELGANNRESDLAFASIVPRGPDLLRQTKLDTLRLKVSAKQPGIIGRLRDDLGAFATQKIETTDEKSLTFTSRARGIPEPSTIRLPVAGAAFTPYLQPTARINSSAPEIVRLAREIVGSDRDGKSVARKIGEWTYTNLTWKQVESSAVGTLASREADCLEHSELYVALARSLGLPARVVTGAAYSSGSFGAHAWVEVYLGRWVEIDPTWGSLDRVDATHLRFDRDTFVYYAMLGQLDLEILDARSIVSEAQRNPLSLLAALDEDEEKSPGAEAFDFALTVAQVFTAEERDKFSEKQKQALLRAFERRVAELYDAEDGFGAAPLTSEINGNQARILALQKGDLVLLTMAAREGAWYIVERTDLDGPINTFADTLRETLQPNSSLLRVWELDDYDKALEYLAGLLKVQGDKPQLLLLKALVLRNQRDLLSDSAEPDEKEKFKLLDPKAPLKLLQEITRRWPDYASGHLWLAREYASHEKNPEQAVGAFRRYNQLETRDPRSWEFLALELEKLQRWEEAALAYQEAINRNPQDYERQVTLAHFHFRRNQLPQVQTALRAAAKIAGNFEDIFWSFSYELDYGEKELTLEEEKRLEQVLNSFPQELARSKNGLFTLARAQNAQNRYADAVKTMQRVFALGAEENDYIFLATLSRQAKRYPEALANADQALKLNKDSARAHYSRAQALAQLGRKKEALAALQKTIEKSAYYANELAEDKDLQPLADMPEFKALLAKGQEEAAKEQLPSQKPDEIKPAPSPTPLLN